MPSTHDAYIALQYKALAHPRRAWIFRLLCERPEVGQSYTILQTATRLQSSSLVHHLREMERCGLIRRRRKGPNVSYYLAAAGLSKVSREVYSACPRDIGPSRQAA